MENVSSRSNVALNDRRTGTLSSLDNRIAAQQPQQPLKLFNSPTVAEKQHPLALPPKPCFSSPSSSSSSSPPPVINDENVCPTESVAANQPTPAVQPLAIVPQTFTTTNQKQRVERTRQRPSVGNKTVASMKNLSRLKDGAKERRLSAEQLKLLSRRIDPSEPLSSPHDSPTKPALPRVLSHASSHQMARRRHQHHHHPRLYQTCSNIWSGHPPMLGDLSHDNIKYLSNLLKARLCQAKIRVLGANSNDDVELPLWPKRRRRVRLPIKRHQPAPADSLTVVGNSRHLFHPRKRTAAKKKGPRMVKREKPQGNNNNNNNASLGKRKNNSNKKSGGPVPSITLEDGTRLFICETCTKRYKNRNGLAYHRTRCKGKIVQEEQRQEESTTEPQQQPPATTDSGEEEPCDEIECVCNRPNVAENAMVQCDKCKKWLHSTCVGISQDELMEDYQCPQCTTQLKDEEIVSCNMRESSQEEEEEDELYEDDSASEKTRQNSNEELLNSSQPLGIATEDDDGLFMSVDNNANLESDPVWEEFTPMSQLESDCRQVMSEPWTTGDREDNNSSYMPLSSWGVSDLGLLQPPSLLYSDATTGMDDDSSLPPSDIMPSTNDSHVPVSDSMWYQFANFGDDYFCDDEQS